MGEATLDIEDPHSLAAYLRDRGISPLEMRVLAGGVSNRTVLVSTVHARWVIKQALSKLRVPDEWFCSTERVHREALAIQLLQGIEPRGVVPQFVFEDRPNHILAMEAVAEPHENWKTMLLAGRMDESHFEQFGRLLADLQSLRPRPEMLSELSDRSFFEALRLAPYYLTSAARVPEAAGFLRDLVARTRERQDLLVHGDFSPKNVLVRDGRLTLLDFEVVHMGDAGFDIGFCMAHFLAKYLHLPDRRPATLRCIGAFLRAYRDAAGVAFDAGRAASAAAHLIGCLMARVAGRSQLEYLSADGKRALQGVALKLMGSELYDPESVVASFAGEVACL